MMLVVIVRRGGSDGGGGDGSASGGGRGGRRRRRPALFENSLTLGQAFHAGQTIRGRGARRVRLGQRRRGRRFCHSATAVALAVNHIIIVARQAATTTIE